MKTVVTTETDPVSGSATPTTTPAQRRLSRARLLEFYKLGLVSRNHPTNSTNSNDAMRFATEALAVWERANPTEDADEAALAGPN